MGGVGDTGRLESLQTEDAAVAATAGAVAVSVTRPGEVKRGAQFNAKPDDLVLPEVNNRRKDSDAGFRARAGIDSTGERVAERLRTIGISGTVFFDGPQIHARRADGFGPGNPQAEKERISERYIREWNVVPLDVGIGNGYIAVRQRRAANPPKRVRCGRQAMARRYAVIVGDFQECPAFARVCPLAVVEIKQREVEIPARDGGGDATVQTAAEQHDGELFHAPLTVATVRFMYEARSSMSEYTVGRMTSVRVVETVSPDITTKPIGPHRRAVPSAVP